MDLRPINEPEVLIRYGRLSANARDRVLDQFYLVYHDGANFKFYLANKTVTVLMGFVSISVPIFVIGSILAKILHVADADVIMIMYLCAAVLQLLFFSTLFIKRTKTKYREYPFQTTEIGLSPTRLFVHTRHIHGGSVKRVVRWQDITSVGVLDVDPATGTGTRVEVRSTDGKVLRLNLDCIQTIEERNILRECFLRFATHVDVRTVTSSLLQVGKNDDVPFTRLWSQALQDARPRVNTEPLAEEALLQDSRYLIKSKIGSGGQGSVYHAELRDVDGVTDVVLKEYVLPDLVHQSEHKTAVDQFEREVRLLGRVSHSGITKLLGAFVEDHRAYLVLEYCNGLSLKDYVDRNGPIDTSRVRRLALQMCDILQFLHTMQPSPIMHLDFSPENILIFDDDHLTVIDFNISAEENSLRTRTVMGKQRYMSPEQYRGKPTTRSDIYSLGATLYFLTTGAEPQPISVSRISKVLPDTDSQLEAIVAKATALEESDRYQSIGELRHDLAALHEQLPALLGDKQFRPPAENEKSSSLPVDKQGSRRSAEPHCDAEDPSSPLDAGVVG